RRDPHPAAAREGQAADLGEAGPGDAAGGGEVLGRVDDPEAAAVLGAQDRLEQARVEAASAPGRQRREVPQVAVAGLEPEREVELADRGTAVGDPAVADRYAAQPGGVAAVARLEPARHLSGRQPGQRAQ